MTTDSAGQGGPAADPPAGERSVVVPRAPARREMVKAKKAEVRRSRPYLAGAGVILLGVLAYVAYGYFERFVNPPRQIAVRVADAEYTRGDVVDFIRFNQRLAEDRGVEFPIGNSLFDALQVIQDNELSVRAAPSLGVSLSPEELEARLENLVGFPGLTQAERENPRTKQNLAEANRQLLNKIGLTEDVYREIVRKALFKEKVRDAVSKDVPRVLPQVHVYEIVLMEPTQQIIQRIERDLRSGDSPADVAVRYSQDPNAKRNNGEAGWFPKGVVPQLDPIFWGTKKDGSRVLPFGLPSDPQYNSEAKSYNIYVVTEYAEARELSEASFTKLADAALQDFLSERRRELGERKQLYMALDDKIYAWVNKQVKLASLGATPTPGSALSQFGLQ
ncbi:MAG: hypothetical protein EXR57_03830 [Dehalococcoidia bacterium]|nr:hypothetical protein [Dehalococcoidia bacterium]MSQ34932.1 hypothetical protein [Dehalococcoidia bacterium]